jgi:hypothetical protein
MQDERLAAEPPRRADAHVDEPALAREAVEERLLAAAQQLGLVLGEDAGGWRRDVQRVRPIGVVQAEPVARRDRPPRGLARGARQPSHRVAWAVAAMAVRMVVLPTPPAPWITVSLRGSPSSSANGSVTSSNGPTPTRRRPTRCIGGRL